MEVGIKYRILSIDEEKEVQYFLKRNRAKRQGRDYTDCEQLSGFDSFGFDSAGYRRDSDDPKNTQFIR